MSQYSSPSPYQQGPAPVVTQTSSSAIISLISGILAWLGVFGLGGILAIIFGHVAKNEIKKSYGRITGDGLATIGLVLGYINVAVTLIGICCFVLIFAGAIGTPACLVPFMNGINSNFNTAP